jgi:hypothetical protein
MFGCVDDEAACPVGYTCEADGCCHRDGSDVDAHLRRVPARRRTGDRRRDE